MDNVLLDYIRDLILVGLGFITCMLFIAHKKAEAPRKSPMTMDIEESYTNLRDGCMTEEDECNLRDAAQFEREDRDNMTVSELIADAGFVIVELDTDRAVRRV